MKFQSCGAKNSVLSLYYAWGPLRFSLLHTAVPLWDWRRTGLVYSSWKHKSSSISANGGIRPATTHLSNIQYNLHLSLVLPFFALLLSPISLGHLSRPQSLFCLFKNTCFLASFPWTLPLHFLPPWPLNPLSLSHNFSFVFCCSFLTAAQDTGQIVLWFMRENFKGMFDLFCESVNWPVWCLN